MLIPDDLYLKIVYKLETGYKLRLNHPITYNEKLQWLKLYNRDSLYTKMVDKYEARKYIAEIIGDQYLVPLLGVWDNADDINFNMLPEKFVLKCTHDSGGVIICKNKENLNVKDIKKRLNTCLKRNFYYFGREWPYKNVKPRIIAEQYLNDIGQEQLTDYKLYAFHGKPQLIQVDYDRFTNHKRQFYDLEWNRLNISWHIDSDTTRLLDKPSVLKEMIILSEKLSYGLYHLRTDFYIVNNKIYAGELTFYPGSGFGKWMPEGIDEMLGHFIQVK